MPRVTKDDMLRAIRPYYSVYGIYDVYDIKRKHCKHFFEPDTMRFFASRLIDDVFPSGSNKVYFVTSEKRCFNDSSRVYNVRKYDTQDDSITTMETLETRTRAITCAIKLAYEGI